MLKNTEIARKLGSVMIAGLMVLTAGVAMAAAPASADTRCGDWLQEDERVGLNDFRAGANCAEIDSDEKVRAHLVKVDAVDDYSSWFTTEYKSYYTAWQSCWAGCSASRVVSPR